MRRQRSAEAMASQTSGTFCARSARAKDRPVGPASSPRRQQRKPAASMPDQRPDQSELPRTQDLVDINLEAVDVAVESLDLGTVEEVCAVEQHAPNIFDRLRAGGCELPERERRKAAADAP